MKLDYISQSKRDYIVKLDSGRSLRARSTLDLHDRLVDAAIAEDRTLTLTTRDQSLLQRVLIDLSTAARVHGGPMPRVGCRGRTGGGGLELYLAGPSESCWQVVSQSGRVDSSMIRTAQGEGLAPEWLDDSKSASCAADARSMIDAWSELDRAWIDAVGAVGLRPARAAGTVSAQLFPREWRIAASVLAKRPEWKAIRSAYYGGRIQCYQPEWEGWAVEYDLKTAYGAALGGYYGKMPDTQVYHRAPYPDQPAWADATVIVRGSPGPIPRRRERRSVEWPTRGRWRGWYTRADLESPGVEVVKIHQWISGRWSDDIQPRIREILSARQVESSAWMRAVQRQVVVAAAGKVVQRPVVWRVLPRQLWHDPPKSALAWGDLSKHVWLYPSLLPGVPICPQLGSYVTARTRGVVYSALLEAGSEALYTDTDSLHLPASAPPPELFDSGPGSWAAKEVGWARYEAVRRYCIGSKAVGMDPVDSSAPGPVESARLAASGVAREWK